MLGFSWLEEVEFHMSCCKILEFHKAFWSSVSSLDGVATLGFTGLLRRDSVGEGVFFCGEKELAVKRKHIDETVTVRVRLRVGLTE